MVLLDVNVLVYAYRPDATDHAAFRSWLDGALSAADPVGVSDLALSGFLRVVTHPRIFAVPSPLERALEFTAALRSSPNVVVVAPSDRHWTIFTDLCRASSARGNLVADAYHAALAIESGAVWVTTDGDYARFPGLRWRHPLRNP